MLSFEVSAIDLILSLAVIILSMLHMMTSLAKEKRLVKEETLRKPEIEATILEEERERLTSIRPQSNPMRCLYGFGYLGKLDKDSSVPKECLSCSRIIECARARS